MRKSWYIKFKDCTIKSDKYVWVNKNVRLMYRIFWDILKQNWDNLYNVTEIYTLEIANQLKDHSNINKYVFSFNSKASLSLNIPINYERQLHTPRTWGINNLSQCWTNLFQNLKNFRCKIQLKIVMQKVVSLSK